MTASHFQRMLIVDWSSANGPKTGADSIWIADSHAPTVNPPTRSAAMAHIRDTLSDSARRGERVLIGWDFAFGYPSGFAKALGVQGWHGVWDWLHTHIEDTPDNRSNRFEVGAKLNRLLGPDDGPFWGHVGQHCPDGLSPRRWPGGPPAEFPYPFDYLRHVEARLPSASPVFKLAYPGSVGSQALLGIARLESLRRQCPGRIAIWPFETGFADDLSAPVVLAEIYPSAHAVPDGPGVTDKRQVEAVLRDFSDWNRADRLMNALGAPDLQGAPRTAVLAEEGWVLGL